MIRFFDLRAILSDGDSVAALEVYYERAWDRILRELALGIARPGAQRARLLVARLRGLLATLDPHRDTYVRHWIRDWIRASFLQAEQSALREIEQGKALRVPARAASDTLANLIGAIDSKLVGVIGQMDAALTSAIRIAHGAILADPQLRGGIVDGVLRNAEGRTVADSLAAILLLGSSPVLEQKLREVGIQRPVVDALARLNGGVINVGRASVQTASYVRTAAQDALVDANNAASLLVVQQNDVDHVYIEREEVKNICPFCLGVQFNVFYTGPLDRDPAGFPRLKDLPPGNHGQPGPKWHQNCAHAVIPWPLRQKSRGEIAAALAKALSIPSVFFGPPGTVEKINHGPGDVSKLRKLA